MRDITAELKELRLYGMAGAWEEVAADENGVSVQTSRWLIEHLLQAEHTDRHMRSVRYPAMLVVILSCRAIPGRASFTDSRMR